MIAVRADCTTPLCTTLYKTAANATAAIVPTAYSAVVMPASSRTSCRNFLIMSATSRQQLPVRPSDLCCLDASKPTAHMASALGVRYDCGQVTGCGCSPFETGDQNVACVHAPF